MDTLDPSFDPMDNPSATTEPISSGATVDLGPLSDKLNAIEARLRGIEISLSNQATESIDASVIAQTVVNLLKPSLEVAPPSIDFSPVLNGLQSNFDATLTLLADVKQSVTTLSTQPTSSLTRGELDQTLQDYVKQSDLEPYATQDDLGQYATAASLRVLAERFSALEAKPSYPKHILIAKQSPKPATDWPKISATTAVAFGQWLEPDTVFNAGWDGQGYVVPQDGVYIFIAAIMLYNLQNGAKFIGYLKSKEAPTETNKNPTEKTLQQFTRATTGGLTPEILAALNSLDDKKASQALAAIATKEWAGGSGLAIATLKAGTVVSPFVRQYRPEQPQLVRDSGYNFFAAMCIAGI